MKRSVKWENSYTLSPFVLFIILCIFIYIPPIQNFLVQQATRYASGAGMHISIKTHFSVPTRPGEYTIHSKVQDKTRYCKPNNLR